MEANNKVDLMYDLLLEMRQDQKEMNKNLIINNEKQNAQQESILELYDEIETLKKSYDSCSARRNYTSFNIVMKRIAFILGFVIVLSNMFVIIQMHLENVNNQEIKQ